MITNLVEGRAVSAYYIITFGNVPSITYKTALCGILDMIYAIRVYLYHGFKG